MKKNQLLTFCLLLLLNTSAMHSAGLFNGLAGIKMDTNFAKSIAFQSFFAGQFNFTPNIIMRTEFSLDTPDIANHNFFDSWTGSGFFSYLRIDEISAIFRQQFFGGSNYVGLYIGQYEPLGSDVFLRRHFNTANLASKITDSWLGLSGSVIYPRFKAGISDVIHFSKRPIAIGLYTYYDTSSIKDYDRESGLWISKDENGNDIISSDGADWTDKSGNPATIKKREHGISTDFRFACAYDYFYIDAVLGLQATIRGHKYDSDDSDTNYASFMRIDEINLQTGVTMLVGNTFTPFSLFLQTGMYSMTLNAKELLDATKKGIPLPKDTRTKWMDESFYLLIEPRMRIKSFGLDTSFFILPKKTVDKLFIVQGSLGGNINAYGKVGYLGKADTTFGCHAGFGFKATTDSFWGNPTVIFSDVPSISASPYMKMEMHTGEFQTMLRLNVDDIIATIKTGNKEYLRTTFELHIGYKAHF